MLNRLASLEQEFEIVEARLADPDLHADYDKLREVTKRHSELRPIVEAYGEYKQAIDDRTTAKEMVAEASGDDKAIMQAEVDTANAAITRLEEELKVLLLPKDPNAGRNVIVEIRGAEGGEEANLFARDLYEMYMGYASAKKWGVEQLGGEASDMGGFTHIAFMVKGDNVWTHMKFEGGVHRVQRVPVTESQGRVHTSSAAVTVLPEADELDVDIKESDLEIDVYRSSGPGGQSVNTTDSAVRITHKPTGVVVAMQDEKSQLQNKAKAMRVLRARILQAEQDRQQAELSAARKDQVGGGGRSEKIRTYNYKENRVSDHRIGLTIYKLDQVLTGALDDVIDPLITNERTRQLSSDG